MIVSSASRGAAKTHARFGATAGKSRSPTGKAKVHSVLAGAFFLCPLGLWAEARQAPVLARELVIDSTENTGAFRFQWSLPAAAGLHPSFARSMRAEAERQLAADRLEAAKARGLAGASATWWKEIEWRVGANTPGVLVLWAGERAFTGGAHANLLYRSVWWDKRRGRTLAVDDMLADPAAAFAALQERFCAALDGERARRRQGSPVELPAFNACPDLAQQVLVPVTVGAGPELALFSVKLPPYAAGPYAEGSYEVAVPVTTGFMMQLKPEWRSAFRVP